MTHAELTALLLMLLLLFGLSCGFTGAQAHFPHGHGAGVNGLMEGIFNSKTPF
jgi:hypothetical protein